jgi:hypothetical protein
MSGGTQVPGDRANPLGTIGVAGSLTFNAGSFCAVHITPRADSAASVVGTPAQNIINGINNFILGAAFQNLANLSGPAAGGDRVRVGDAGQGGADIIQQQLSICGTGYGGSGRVSGEAAVGSHDHL